MSILCDFTVLHIDGVPVAARNMISVL